MKDKKFINKAKEISFETLFKSITMDALQAKCVFKNNNL
jgi:hypothetical protein